MAFMTLKTIVFKNEKLILTLFDFAVLFFFVYLLPAIVSYRSHMTILFSWEGASLQISLFLKNPI